MSVPGMRSSSSIASSSSSPSASSSTAACSCSSSSSSCGRPARAPRGRQVGRAAKRPGRRGSRRCMRRRAVAEGATHRKARLRGPASRPSGAHLLGARQLGAYVVSKLIIQVSCIRHGCACCCRRRRLRGRRRSAVGWAGQQLAPIRACLDELVCLAPRWEGWGGPWRRLLRDWLGRLHWERAAAAARPHKTADSQFARPQTAWQHWARRAGEGLSKGRSHACPMERSRWCA